MKRTVALVLAAVLMAAAACKAQTNPPVEMVLSNVYAAIDSLQAQLSAAKALGTVQTVVFSNGIPIATNTAPATFNAHTIESYTNAGIKLVEALGGLVAALFAAARILRKAIPDNLQTGTAGLLLRHVALEVNPPTKAELKANPATNEPPPQPPT